VHKTFVPNQSYDVRRLRDYHISHVLGSAPHSLLHKFVALINSFLKGWNDPLHCNPLVNFWQNRPRLDTADLVCEHHRFLYLVSAGATLCAGGVCAYLDSIAFEGDLPTGILDKSVVDIASKHIWIPSAKVRRFTHQGVRFFPEERRMKNMSCNVEANAYRLDQPLRRASTRTIKFRMVSSRLKVEGTIIGSTCTSPENGAGAVCAASVLSNFTHQRGRLLWEIVRTQHIH
jgi:hypothetical protein